MSDWPRLTLGELTKNTRPICYGVLKPGPLVTDGVPLIRIQDLDAGDVDTGRLHYISTELDSEFARSRLEGGEILLSIQGTVGRVAVCPLDLGGANISRTIALIAPDSRIDRRFLALYLSYLGEANLYETTGSTRASLNISTLRKISVPVPTREEQARIVHQLDAQLESLGAGTSSVDEAGALASGLASQLLDRATAGFERRSLESCLEAPLANGRSVPTAPTGFPVLRLTALRGNGVLLDESKIGAWSATEAKPFLVSKGDFLVARGNGSLDLVGRGGLVDKEPSPIAFPDTMIRIRVDQKVIRRDFFSLIWNSSLVRGQIEAQVRTTAGIYKINQKTLRNIEVAVPPIHEQVQIAKSLSNHLGEIVSLQEAVQIASGAASKLQTSIFHSAFDHSQAMTRS